MVKNPTEFNDIALDRLMVTHINFSCSLFSEVVKHDFEKNIFISPFSIASVLSVVCNGARGTTQEAIVRALQIQEMDLEELNNAFLKLWARMDSVKAAQVVTANSLWVRKDVALQSVFVDQAQKYYRAEVMELELDGPAALEKMNSWVKQATQQKIPGIVNRISSEMVMLLLNAIYFKGLWHHRFDEAKTKKRPFTLLDGSEVMHPMMSLPRPAKLPYLCTQEFQAVSLPYKGDRLSLYIFLPDRNVALAEFLGSLTAKNWQGWLSRFTETEGYVVLPRFKLKYFINLKERLAALGMGVAFDKMRADFEHISTTRPLWIDAILHESFVDVNEEGTEAAAMTVAKMTFGISRSSFQMIVDRPFFFAIRDDDTEILLFMGVVVDPGAGTGEKRVALRPCLVRSGERIYSGETPAAKASIGQTVSRLEVLKLPPIQNIHSWSTEQVQVLQQQTAEAMGLPVVFRDRLQDGREGPEMVIIPAGTFLMGSPETEGGRDYNDCSERQHEVTLSLSFAIGKYAVTFDEYDQFCAAVGREWPGAEFGRGRQPVVNVSWQDAMAYCAWLSEQTGQAYGLPSEAEWEYACRAGTTTPFHFGETISSGQANYDGTDCYGAGPEDVWLEKTLEVGRFPPNAWGLYDMHGNIMEFTGSPFDKEYSGAEVKLLGPRQPDNTLFMERGGSYLYGPHRARSAYREKSYVQSRKNWSGFRLARSL